MVVFDQLALDNFIAIIPCLFLAIPWFCRFYPSKTGNSYFHIAYSSFCLLKALCQQNIVC